MEKLQPRIVPLKSPVGNQSEMLKQFHPFIRQSGNDWRKPWYLADRCLFDYMLVYISKGTGVFTLEDDMYPIKKGDLFWTPPNTRHSMRGTSPEMHCLYVHFDFVYDSERSHWNAMVPGGLTDLSPWQNRMHPPVNIPEINALRGMLPFHGQHHDLLELFEKLCREHLRCSGHSLTLSGIMLELLDLIIQNVSNRPQHCGHDAIMEEAAVYLRSNACKINSIEDVASRFGFSVSHFRRLFSEYYGQSPSMLINRYRMKQACELLAYNNCTVTETADRCGYKSIYSFSRAFMQYYGVSPSSYRN